MHFHSPSPLAEELTRMADPLNPLHQEHLEKGWSLFEKGRVQLLAESSRSFIARITDEMPFVVQMDRHSFLKSSCSCDHEGLFCPHQVAAFFYLFESPSAARDWFSKWKIAARTDAQDPPGNGKKMGELPPGDTGGREEPAASAYGLNGMKNPGEKGSGTFPAGLPAMAENSGEAAFRQSFAHSVFSEDRFIALYGKWTEAVDEMFSGFRPSFPVLPERDIRWRIWKSLVSKCPSDPSLGFLYELTISIRFLYHLFQEESELAATRDPSSHGYPSGPVIDVVLRQTKNTVNRFPKPLPLSFEPVLEKLAKDLREFLYFNECLYSDLLSIYWFLWTRLFISRRLRESELEFAKWEWKKAGEGTLLHGAYMIQLFLSNRPEEVIKEWEKAPVGHFWLLALFLNRCGSQGNWPSFKILLHPMLKQLRPVFLSLPYDRQREMAETLGRLLKDYCVATGGYREFESAMASLLPFSTPHLYDFYLERKDYRAIVELYCSHFREQARFPKEFESRLKKEAPEMLLPVYHWEIKELLDEKNRESYREAVRILKKLKQTYKKIQRMEDWKRYFLQLLASTQRLRAFQEELEKGGLKVGESETI